MEGLLTSLAAAAPVILLGTVTLLAFLYRALVRSSIKPLWLLDK